MVPQQTSKRKTLINYEILPLCVIGGLIVALILMIVLFVIMNDKKDTAYEDIVEMALDAEVVGPMDEEKESTTEVAPPPVAINLQPVVDTWVESTGGDKGVIIYDLKRDEVIGEYHADEDFETEAQDNREDPPIDAAGAFYQSIIDGAEVDQALIAQALVYAEEDPEHYLLPAAAKVVQEKVILMAT